MAETKYGQYIIREPLERARFAPGIHICAEEGCGGAKFPSFPSELTFMTITEPLIMNPEPHAHDYDQFLCFLGGNSMNFVEFDAEVEVYLGEEGEKHIVDTATIVYIPKGLMHCPIKLIRVSKPIIFGHICFAPTYTRSVGDMSGHPVHRERKSYSPEELIKLRAGKPL